MIREGGQGFVPHLGGAPFNVAVGAKRNGSDCAFVGTVGEDIWGKYLVDEAPKYGVECHIATDSTHLTPLAFVDVEHGERKFEFLRKDSSDNYLNIGELSTLVPKANVLHFGSLPLSSVEGRARIAHSVECAKAHDVLVSFDVNLREGVWTSEEDCKSHTLEMIERCDLVKMSEEEWNKLSPEMERLVEQYPSKVICVTLGADGALLYKDGYQSYVPAVAVEAVDTTGAGDAFVGCLLAMCDQMGKGAKPTHEDLVGLIEKANRYAANVVTHFGAI